MCCSTPMAEGGVRGKAEEELEGKMRTQWCGIELAHSAQQQHQMVQYLPLFSGRRLYNYTTPFFLILPLPNQQKSDMMQTLAAACQFTASDQTHHSGCHTITRLIFFTCWFPSPSSFLPSSWHTPTLRHSASNHLGTLAAQAAE